jgi:biopolymer transport protein ExbD
MGKVKIKRKSTLIDMTAMSDVTVLLLTFFMLTSTFLAKEPTVVNTPSSVSEEKVPMSNLVTVLVSGKDKLGNEGNPETEGKVFISFVGNVDSTLISSEKLRLKMLDAAVNIYNEKRGKKLSLTDQQRAVFAQLNMFGVSFDKLSDLLDPTISQSERDKFQGDMTNPHVGIPYEAGKADRNKERFGKLNDFQIWLEAINQVAGDSHRDLVDKIAADDPEKAREIDDLFAALRTGKAIAVKADKNTPVSVVEDVFDNLQTMNLNKFTLMTALKSEDEPTQ